MPEVINKKCNTLFFTINDFLNCKTINGLSKIHQIFLKLIVSLMYRRQTCQTNSHNYYESMI